MLGLDAGTTCEHVVCCSHKAAGEMANGRKFDCTTHSHFTPPRNRQLFERHDLGRRRSLQVPPGAALPRLVHPRSRARVLTGALRAPCALPPQVLGVRAPRRGALAMQASRERRRSARAHQEPGTSLHPNPRPDPRCEDASGAGRACRGAVAGTRASARRLGTALTSPARAPQESGAEAASLPVHVATLTRV